MSAPGGRSLLAFYGHRLSGLALAVFLPVHFTVLALVLTDPARVDDFLAYTQIPLVKAAETLLMALFTLHLAFGLRLLVMELAPWPALRQLRGRWVDGGIIAAVAVAAGFFWVALTP